MASADTSIPDNAVYMTRFTVNVLVKVTMGCFKNQNLGPPVYPIAEGLSSFTVPITEDAEVATDTANPSPDQVQDPELPLHSEMTCKEPTQSLCS